MKNLKPLSFAKFCCTSNDNFLKFFPLRRDASQIHIVFLLSKPKVPVGYSLTVVEHISYNVQ